MHYAVSTGSFIACVEAGDVPQAARKALLMWSMLDPEDREPIGEAMHVIPSGLCSESGDSWWIGTMNVAKNTGVVCVHNTRTGEVTNG